MCGKCEGKMAKAGLGIGMLSTLLAVVTRLAPLAPMGLGPRSFCAMAALMFLMSIAAASCHSHETPGS